MYHDGQGQMSKTQCENARNLLKNRNKHVYLISNDSVISLSKQKKEGILSNPTNQDRGTVQKTIYLKFQEKEIQIGLRIQAVEV